MSGPLVVAATRADLDALLRERGGRVALVPTMGALHEGHETLLRHAVERADTTVASVFVNPTQFAPGEDLDRYPRTLDDDLVRCDKAGVDVVFAPSVDEMYPGWPSPDTVSVDPGPLGTVLEGASRPTHFRGVLTVVAKLLGLVRPDLAVFGEKDYQQLALVTRMARTLCLPVDVLGAPTVREDDGLAMSSRNRFLDDAQRRDAVALSRALDAGVAVAAGGHDAVLAAARAVLDDARGVDLDYLALTDTALGDPRPDAPARLLVAARVGTTRLIDNAAVPAAAAPEEAP